MALKRALRLRKSSEFQRVRQRGRSIASRLLVFAWMPNHTAQVHVGFVVGKRTAKLAVERNYLKRRLGEALRPHLAGLTPGWDMVFSARKDALTADLPLLEQDMVVLLRRARLLAPAQSQSQEMQR